MVDHYEMRQAYLRAIDGAHKMAENLIGKRIELIYTNDEYTKLEPHSFGTIDHIDDFGTIFVKWDSGSSLGLIPGVDKYRVIY